MNRDQAQELLPIITAFAGGKSVQWRYITSPHWIDTTDPNFALNFEWRIKPLEFPKLPDGLEWSNPSGLRSDQIGADFRPLTTKECNGEFVKGAFYWNTCDTGGEWRQHGDKGCYADSNETIRVPISTPFPEPPKPKVMVPLEPHDISPVDVLRHKDRKSYYSEHWVKIDAVNSDGPAVHFAGSGRMRIPFTTLMNGWEISRDGAKTWNPCEKESES